MNLARYVTELSWWKCLWCPTLLINTEVAFRGYKYTDWIVLLLRLISHRRQHGWVFGTRYRMLICARPQLIVQTCGCHAHVAHWVSRVSIESRLRGAEMHTPLFIFLKVFIAAWEGVWDLLTRSMLLLHLLQQECLGTQCLLDVWFGYVVWI